MDQRIRVLLPRVHLGRGSPAREDEGDLLTQAVELSCDTIPSTLGLPTHCHATPGPWMWAAGSSQRHSRIEAWGLTLARRVTRGMEPPSPAYRTCLPGYAASSAALAAAYAGWFGSAS